MSPVNNHIMNNNTSHTSSFDTTPSPVITENPNAVLTPPDLIQLTKMCTYYAEVAEPLKSVYGMIRSSECPSVDDYKSLSKEAQHRLKAYVPVDLAIAKFKMDKLSKRLATSLHICTSTHCFTPLR
jgi:hypothetical protein